MAYKIEHEWGAGFGWIMGVVILAVIIYTFIRLRKQVSETEASKKRSSEKLEKQPSGKEKNREKR